MSVHISAKKILVPDPRLYNVDDSVQAYLSFAPYYRQLKKKLTDPGLQFAEFYQNIIDQLDQYPELLGAISTRDLREEHQYILELIAATIIPFSADENIQYFSLGTPYKFEVFFYSSSYAQYFSPDENGFVKFPPERPFEQLQDEFVQMAYRMAFRHFYSTELRIPERTTNRWLDKSTGLQRYSRLHIDESFVDVKLMGDLPPYPADLVDKNTGVINNLQALRQQVPLSLFRFEGFFFRRSIVDVTVEECVTQVKNALIEMQSEHPEPGYDKLKSSVETLIGYRDVAFSLSPVLRLNKRYVFYNAYSGRSLLLSRIADPDEREYVYNRLAVYLSSGQKPFFISDLKHQQESAGEFPLMRQIREAGFCCYLVAPLMHNNELIGMMEAASPVEGVLNNQVIRKLEPVYAFFELACKNYNEQFRNEIETLVKERFTALQPIVEWKFSEEAWSYLKGKERNAQADIGTIRFNEVYPVFGAVDIRNSTKERSRYAQQDLLNHLRYIDQMIEEMKPQATQPVKEYFQSLLTKNELFRSRIREVLLAEDESRIKEYLDHDVHSFFKHLANGSADLSVTCHRYMKAADETSGELYEQRRKFEESISKLNAFISRHLEKERDRIQLLYPHYFEKFRTDGVEFNIYIGESFTPQKSFDYIYLKNIRLWQLSTLAELTRLAHTLNNELPLPLETTQLILVYDQPICISFRKDERRFDVEGAEGIRFEILKKRLDKVRVKNTGQRLTQPGTIALVYSHDREAAEYDEYFRFLVQKNLLTAQREHLELEEVQGISGLKAMRFHVNLEP